MIKQHLQALQMGENAVAKSAEYAEHKCWDPKDGELLLAFRCRNGKELTTDTRVQTQDGSHFLSLHVLGPQQREQRGHGRVTCKNKLSLLTLVGAKQHRCTKLQEHVEL